MSDVLVGAAVGTAVGLAVPWLHRGRDAPAVALAPWPGGVSVTGRF